MDKMNPIKLRKELNVDIFRDTTEHIKIGCFRTPQGRTIDFCLKELSEKSECLHDALPPVNASDVEGGTELIVENCDCLKAAGRLVSEGLNPALLNFASGGHPGGGVETGARAQEETICRRSTLSYSIYGFDSSYAERYGYPYHAGNNYSLKNLNSSLIYSPGVTVFKEGTECTLMEDPFKIAVITCAALNLNGKYELKLDESGNMPAKAKEITTNKVRNIFRVALMHGHDSMVLGAFGCGAFRNPPEEMAAIFHNVLDESEFKNKFRLVTFAIIDDHNSDNRNLASFKNEFAGYGDDDNTSRFIGLLKNTGREGIDRVVRNLRKEGFFSAPGSINYHSNYRGGLLEHSLKVYDEAVKAISNFADSSSIPKESIVISCLLHDVCKCDSYCISAEGLPVRKEERFPIGHGEKSVIMLMGWGLKMTQDEMLAIRWHMGKHSVGPNDERIYHDALTHPLCRVVINADYAATH